MQGVTGLYDTHEPAHRAPAPGPAVPGLVEVVTGADAIARRFRQLRLTASEEVRALVADGPAVLAEVAEEAGCRVRHRVVIERAVRERPHGITSPTGAPGRDEQVRVVDTVPTPLVIADRALALVPLVGVGAEPAALVVHAGELLELLSALFESVWRDAQPPRPATADIGGLGDTEDRAPDPTDLDILSLLLAGLTDASVAKQLDLGLRTVQRRVRRLMELAGVTTRLQLGWHAYERGWVTRGR